MSGKMEEIVTVVLECESTQHSRYESDFTKEQAKISAYNEIKYILFGSKEVGVVDDDD